MNKQYLHGAVLLLEESDTEAILCRKCADMRSIGLNTVVIWPPVFYRGGKRDFSIQKLLLDCADKEGLKVIVELTGQVSNLEYLPDSEWRAEYAVTNSDGTPELMQNGLGELNYNHPEVKRIIKEFFHETIAELKDYPALFAWDIWNETHFKNHDHFTINEFREFLKCKYRDIAELNSIWKKSYTSFDQIRFDPVTWASIMPDCDWEEFRTDNLAAIAGEWADTVHAADPLHPVIADNVMSNAVWSEFDRGTDDWKLAEKVDCFGISFYPKTGGRLLKVNEPWLRCLTFAGAASAGHGSFLISEMQSHCYSEIFTTERVSADELTDWNLEALFQGSVGNIYWKWEPFKTGFQVGGRGLVLADGSFSKRTQAVKEFSELLDAHPDLHSLKPVRHAAVLYDRTSNFTVKAVNNRVRGMIGDDQCARARFGVVRTAYERNIPMAVVTPGQIDRSGFSLLFLPYQVVMTEMLAEELRTFMRNGGTIAANYPCGDIDPLGRLHENLPGGPLNELLQARQIDNIVDSFQGTVIELQELEITGNDVEILLQTDSGKPLLLHTRFSGGRFLYFAANPWDTATCENAFWEHILQFVDPVLIRATLPVLFANGKVFDYLLVNNETQAPECAIHIDRKTELIFGTGELTRRENNLLLKNPRHCILRLEKK